MVGKVYYTDVFIDAPLRDGIMLRRDEDGNISTNVPHATRHHSPDGYEYGYAGSGPADLALNIVEAVLRSMDYRGRTTKDTWDKRRIFEASFRLHQRFKFDWLVALPRTPGEFVLDYEDIVRWIGERLEREGE